jgi:hypothetical protein
MTERTDFADIQGVPVRLVYPRRSKPEERVHWERGRVIIKQGRKIIGFVNRDDLFDGNGNWFLYNNVGE